MLLQLSAGAVAIINPKLPLQQKNFCAGIKDTANGVRF
jgi:hypothetical protein